MPKRLRLAPSLSESRLLERLALPSWVVPGSVAQNARFLKGKTGQITLCCFESAACLNYTSQDLAPWLASLGLIWHVHLPLDLPWEKGPEEVALLCLALRKKLLFLKPRSFTLHPPVCPDPRPPLERFSLIWHGNNGERLLLENTAHFNHHLLTPEFLKSASFSFCLDASHAVGFLQTELMASSLPEMALHVHWSAPCGRDAHKSLEFLSISELACFKNLASRLPAEATHVLEIFSWTNAERSLPVLKDIILHR